MIMKYKKNIRYLIYKDKYGFLLYLRKNNRFLNIYSSERNCPEELWLDNNYKDFIVLKKDGDKLPQRVQDLFTTNKNETEESCYILLKEIDDTGTLMELLNQKVLLANILWKNCKFAVRTVGCYPNEKTDVVIRLWYKKEKSYSLYSIVEGYIFGPYHYSIIEEHASYDVLDSTLYIENNGRRRDLSEYYVKEIETDTYSYEVYFNENDDVFIMLDRLYYMSPDEYEDNIRECETENVIYKYDMSTEKLELEIKTNDFDNIWTYQELRDAADIAYEGHSRLELGLED